MTTRKKILTGLPRMENNLGSLSSSFSEKMQRGKDIYFNNLPTHYKDFIEEYSGFSGVLNTILRQGVNEARNAFGDDDVNSQFNILQFGLEMIETGNLMNLNESFIVYRKVPNDVSLQDALNDSGFKSTSLNPTKIRGNCQKESSYLLRIRVPRGMEFFAVEDSDEIVLLPEQKLKLISPDPKRIKFHSTFKGLHECNMLVYDTIVS